MVNIKDVVLPSEAEAAEVLVVLRKLLNRYESVTVGDYLELVGLSASYTDQTVGWTALGDIPITPVQDGFLLDLPDPTSF